MKQGKHFALPVCFFPNTCNCNSIWNQQLFWALYAFHQIAVGRNTFPSDLQNSDIRVIKIYSEFNIHISTGAVWEYIIPTRTQNAYVKDDWMRKISFLVRHNRTDLSLLHISSQEAQCQKKTPNQTKKKKNKKIKRESQCNWLLGNPSQGLEILGAQRQNWWLGGLWAPATSGFYSYFKSHNTSSEIEDEVKEITAGQNPTLCCCR